MKIFRVFYVDSTEAPKHFFGKNFRTPEFIRFTVTRANPAEAKASFKDCLGQVDLVVFGSSLRTGSVVRLAKDFRSLNLAIPIFVISNGGRTPLPDVYKRAGVDDLIDADEIGTPLFTWSFVSSIDHVVLKKKAKGFDVLHNRLHSAKSSLGSLVHEINNPLSVIRLTLYHLESGRLSPQRREVFMKLLLDNLERIELLMKDFSVIYRRLDGQRSVRAKILSLNPRAAASR